MSSPSHPKGCKLGIIQHSGWAASNLVALHAVCMLKSFLSCLVMLRDHGGSSVSKSTVSCANLIHLDLNPRGVPMGAMKSDPHIVAHQAKGNVRKQCGAFMSLLNLHQSLVVCRMIRVILCSDNRQKDVDSQSTCINRCAISMTRHDQAFFPT